MKITNNKSQIANNSKKTNQNIQNKFEDLIIMILVLFGIWCLGFDNLAAASYISLNTSVTTKVENNQLIVKISATNKGDESSYNVQAEALLGGQKFLSDKQPELGINSTYHTLLKIPISYKLPGLYPLVIFMHYTDANQYPFTALNGQIFPYQSTDIPAEIFGRILGTTFWKDGELKLMLKNISSSTLATKTHLIVPVELTVEQNLIRKDLPPRSETELSLPIKNFSALSGSNYQVFAVTEYDKDGRHFSVFSPGTIKIAQEQKLFGLAYPIIFGCLAILVLIFVSAQFIKWPK